MCNSNKQTFREGHKSELLKAKSASKYIKQDIRDASTDFVGVGEFDSFAAELTECVDEMVQRHIVQVPATQSVRRNCLGEGGVSKK